MPDPAIEPIARALCLRGSAVLLCRNTKHGYLYLPGGHIEFGEPAAEALVRELAEETDLPPIAPAAARLVLVTEQTFRDRKRSHHELNLVFHMEHDWPEQVVSREDGIAFDWVDLAAVPDLDIRPPEIKAWLAAGGMVAGGPTAGFASGCDPELKPDAPA
jgi:ADP-ribose pyrophosphatase YjhB (NUDIX family)